MPTIRTCDQCGAPLDHYAPEGVCPRCMLNAGLPGAESGLATQATASPSLQDLVPPDSKGSLGRFGEYELIEEIARGGMGVVYKARQVSLDRIVALKMILFGSLASSEQVRRFRIEASAAGSLQHPNIVAVHEVGLHDGQNFLVMDYVDGPNLARFIQDRPLPVKQAATYLKTIAEAIHYAHERGILHRDLKPSNVLIGSDDRPRVTDFGLAKRFDSDSSLTLTGQVLGSPNYMPPEQAGEGAGKMGRRSDVYSLGAILYHLLTGRPPFRADTLTETLRQLHDSEPLSPRLLNPSVPSDLETICLKCLAKEPAKRFASAQDLAGDLARFLNGEPIHARPVTHAERAWRWCRRKPALAGFVAATSMLLLAILIGSPIALFRINRERWRAEESLYAADMRLVQQALAENNLGHAVELLKRNDPNSTNRLDRSSRLATDLRGWEWRYLWQQCQSDEHVLLGRHEGPVERVAFSPDGKFLASASKFASSLKLWDLQRQREVRSVKHTNNIWQIAFSPKGEFLVAASEDELWFYDPRSLQPLGPPVTYPDGVDGLAFNPDGNWLAVLTGEHLLLLDTDRKTEIERHSVPRGWGLAASSDGKWLAMGTRSASVVLWDIERKSIRASPPAQSLSGSAIHGTLVFSPDNRFLVSGCWEREVLVWEVKTLARAATLTRDGALLGGLAFSKDSKALLVAGADQKITLYDTVTWQPLDQRQGHKNEIWSLAVSPDGRTLASGAKDNTIRLWDWTTKPREPHSMPLPPATDGLRLSQDGRTLLTVAMNSTFSLWDTETLAHLTTRPLPFTNLVHHVLSGRTRAVVTTDRKLMILGGRDGSVTAWDTRSLEPVRAFKGLTNGVSGLDLSPDNAILAAAEWGNRFVLWRLATAEVLLVVTNTPIETTLFNFSQDAKTLISAEYGGSRAAIWDMPGGKLRAVFHPPNQQTFESRAAPNSLVAASAVNDGTVRVWDVRTGQERVALGGQVNSFHCVAWTPDGSRLAASGGDGSITVWSAATYAGYQEVAKLKGHRSAVHAVRFLPDGNTLVSVSRDELIVWRAPALVEAGLATQSR